MRKVWIIWDNFNDAPVKESYSAQRAFKEIEKLIDSLGLLSTEDEGRRAEFKSYLAESKSCLAESFKKNPNNFDCDPYGAFMVETIDDECKWKITDSSGNFYSHVRTPEEAYKQIHCLINRILYSSEVGLIREGELKALNESYQKNKDNFGCGLYRCLKKEENE